MVCVHLSFALDLGWVVKTGIGALEVIEELRGRLSYVHLRDWSGSQFVDIGEGTTDIDGLVTALGPVLGDDGWLVVEYETGPQEMERYERAYERLCACDRLREADRSGTEA